MESTNDFVSRWVFCIPGKKIDEICDRFDIDFSNSDVKDAICGVDLINPEYVGKTIWMMVMDKLEDKLKEDYPTFDENKFSWYYGGADACDLYYKEKPFSNIEEFETILYQK